MKRFLVLLVLATMTSAAWAAGARDKDVERVDAAATVLDEIMAAPDKGIPQEVIGSAEWKEAVSACRSAARRWTWSC